MKKIFSFFIIIVLILILRQTYYYIGYLSIINEEMINIKEEYPILEKKEYDNNLEFQMITIDTKTISEEDFVCTKNEDYQDIYCENGDIKFMYISSLDLKIDIENSDMLNTGISNKFYRYSINKNDVIKYLKNKNIITYMELNNYFKKEKYERATIFNSTSEIKDIIITNWIKYTITPKYRKIYVIKTDDFNYAIYENDSRFIIEATNSKKGFTIAVDKKIDINKILLLIDSVKAK